MYTIHRGRQHIYRLRYHPLQQHTVIPTLDDIIQQGKVLTTNLFWTLVDHLTSQMPHGTEHLSNLRIVRWDMHIQKRRTKHPPDIQVLGSMYSTNFEFLLFVLLKSEEWPGESSFAIGQQIFLLSAASCSVFPPQHHCGRGQTRRRGLHF
jgi:hypothetical protein